MGRVTKQYFSLRFETMSKNQAKLDRIRTVCNFQFMKSPLELNSLLSKLFCSPGLLYHLIRRDTGRLANEVFMSNLIVSSRQWFSDLNITN